MTDTINAIGGAGSAVSEAAKLDAAPVAYEGKRADIAVDPAQQRLVIEPVSSHRYVYKVMDSKTGEVIRQLPTEHVEKMITDPGYEQGNLVKTSA